MVITVVSTCITVGGCFVLHCAPDVLYWLALTCDKTKSAQALSVVALHATTAQNADVIACIYTHCAPSKRWAQCCIYSSAHHYIAALCAMLLVGARCATIKGTALLV